MLNENIPHDLAIVEGLAIGRIHIPKILKPTRIDFVIAEGSNMEMDA